jgi:methionyl-tRNA formyltransferase
VSIILFRQEDLVKRRVIFFGTRCSFADRVSRALLDEGHDIAARIIPGYPGAPIPFQTINDPVERPGNKLPLVQEHGATTRTAESSLHPTIMVHDHQDSRVSEYLAEFEADIAIVCCYPRRLPLRLMESTSLGGINIHPSLLPAYRGPEPLFWTYRDGMTTSGVTIHRVDSKLDTGPIVAQRHVRIEIGTAGDQLWGQAAEIAGEMLPPVLSAPEEAIEKAVPQSTESASYFTWPTQADLVIHPELWDAWRLFHFCRGVLPLGYTPLLKHAGGEQTITAAEGYVNNPGDCQEARDASVVEITCRTGSVSVLLSPVSR